MYEAEAKERQRASGRFAGKDSEGNPIVQDVQIIEQPETPEPKSIQKAATAFGVNRQYIADIKRISKEAPEVLKKIESGSMEDGLKFSRENSSKSYNVHAFQFLTKKALTS